jgi:anion-transporting  ArsA/GET3 family ATPase
MDAIVRLLFKNRVMTAFIDAVPGLHDLLQLGKIENLLNEPSGSDPHYDLLVVDAPATGHGVTLLASARTMSEMSRVGPFHDLAKIIERQLEDPKRTAVVVVTLPEDLPVSETLELLDQLGDERALVGTVVVNGVRDEAIPASGDWERVRQDLAASPDPDLRELLRLADGQVERQGLERAAVERLDAGVSAVLGRRVAVAKLPRVEPHDVGPSDVQALADALYAQLVNA